MNYFTEQDIIRVIEFCKEKEKFNRALLTRTRTRRKFPTLLNSPKLLELEKELAEAIENAIS